MNEKIISYEDFVEEFNSGLNFHIVMMHEENMNSVREENPNLAVKIHEIIDGKIDGWGKYFKSDPELIKPFYQAYKVLYEKDSSCSFLKLFKL